MNNTKVKDLEPLLNQKDFEFINSCNNEINKIDNLIQNNEDRIDDLKAYIKECKSDSKKESAKSISSLVKSNIKLLNELKDSLVNIKDETTSLLVSYDSSNLQDNLDQAKGLESKVDSYMKLFTKNTDKISKNDNEIDSFITKNVASKIQLKSHVSSKNELNSTKSSTKSALVSGKIKAKDLASTLNITSSIFEKNNNILLISETREKVYLPYTENEVNRYIEQFPNEYDSFDDVILKEYIVPISYYKRKPVVARFREAYSLLRDKEGSSIIEAMKFAFGIMFKGEINPAIISACQTKEQLEHYIELLNDNKLEEFSDFEIKYDVLPFSYK